MKYKEVSIGIVSIASIFLGYILYVYYSFSYKSWNDSIAMLLISVPIFAISFFIFKYRYASWIKKGVIFILVFIIIVIAIVILINGKNNYRDHELKNNGFTTTAKIINFQTVKHKRSDTYYATFTYFYRNKKYIQRVNNDDKIYQINQTVTIRISSKNPEMFKLIK